MKVHKVKSRNLELDTKGCMCINNRLWNREKVQFINGGTEFIAPKYYAPRHISEVKAEKLKQARQRLKAPLKNLKKIEPPKRKRYKPKEPRYTFYANYLTEEQYKQLYGFFYSKIKPNGRRSIKTIEQLKKEKKQ